MKTNIFRVKKKEEKKILIEEDKYKNPLLLFLLRHKSFIILLLGLLLIMIMLINVGLAFSLFGTSTDFDISYITGDEIIETITDPTIKDEDIMTAITGTNTEGVVILKEKIMTSTNDIISYYSDGVAIIVKSDGSIYKVYPDKNGEYGIDKNGKISDTVIKGRLTSRSNTLADGTIITYYSDNSAVVEHNGTTIYVRNSNGIDNNNATFIEVNPSGVSIETESKNIDKNKVIKFTDGTYLIINGDNKYLVNKKTKVTATNDKLEYEKHNSFSKIREVKLKNGNTITYFEDGAAVIETEQGKYIYVNKSADIFIKDNDVYEIVTNNKGYNTFTKICPDGVKVTYYDNGAAVITTNNNKKYVVDSNNIIYDQEGKISKINEETSNTKTNGKMISGEKVTNFFNNKSEVINKDGTSYITDSNTIKLVDNTQNNTPNNNSNNNNDNNADNNDDNDNNKNSTGGGPPSEKEYIYVSDSTNTYNYSKSIETTNFTISNRYKKALKFRIVIEEVNNYKKFNTERLEPKYVKFQALIGGEYVSSRTLTTETWTTPENKLSYVIYDGLVNAKSKTSVNLSLNVDYAPLDNSFQNKGFIGTIKVYLITDEESS